jgi:hypothetical protein
MQQRKSSGFPLWRASALALATMLCLFIGAWQQASAATGPFAEFSGTWTGTGKIRVGDEAERIRCSATYRLNGTHEVNLQLACASDSYKFDLTGDFSADESNNISGRWTERSRNVGGAAIGSARSGRFQIHVESSAFSGNLTMVTRNRRQSVAIDTQGGGQKAEASITLSRASR